VSARGEQRRAEIVEAALDLFTKRGYHDTGVADIASQLGMSHGTFYRYFESKRDILDHLVDVAGLTIQQALATGSRPDAATTLDEYRAQVTTIAAALSLLVQRDPRIVRLLLFEATGIDAAMTAKVMSLIDAMRDLTAGYLQHGIDAGFLAADLDVSETARALNGMVFAGTLSALRAEGGPDDGAERFASAAVRLMFDGIA
jgi:AcrR family transcriptional regulator